jgi:AraC-like DNA-binding protein
VSAVAQQVGFSDASAFARAFRRWTGVLPHEHVRALRLRGASAAP